MNSANIHSQGIIRKYVSLGQELAQTKDQLRITEGKVEVLTIENADLKQRNKKLVETKCPPGPDAHDFLRTTMTIKSLAASNVPSAGGKGTKGAAPGENKSKAEMLKDLSDTVARELDNNDDDDTSSIMGTEEGVIRDDHNEGQYENKAEVLRNIFDKIARELDDDDDEKEEDEVDDTSVTIKTGRDVIKDEHIEDDTIASKTNRVVKHEPEETTSGVLNDFINLLHRTTSPVPRPVQEYNKGTPTTVGPRAEKRSMKKELTTAGSMAGNKRGLPVLSFSLPPKARIEVHLDDMQEETYIHFDKPSDLMRIIGA